jgi:hypothetical protein
MFRGVRPAFQSGIGGVMAVSPREFIRVWQQSNSVAEVAQKVRRNKSACRVRAHRYRRRGVPLKEFPAPVYMTTEEFWDDLIQYAASLLPAEDQPGSATDGAGAKPE